MKAYILVMNKMINKKNTIGIIILVIIGIVIGPLVTIWSLNTLFKLGILYTWETWIAAAWLTVIVYGATKTIK